MACSIYLVNFGLTMIFWSPVCLALTHPSIEYQVHVEVRWVFQFLTRDHFLRRTGGWGLDRESKLLGGEKMTLWTREYSLGRWEVRTEKHDGRLVSRSRGEDC